MTGEEFAIQNREYVCSAQECIEFIPVSDIQEVIGTFKASSKGFHPTFTHQLFGDMEEIHGYKNVSVQIFYTPASLETYIKYDYVQDEQYAKADSTLEDIMTDALDHEYHQTVEAFQPFVESDKNFKPPGTLLSQYTRDEVDGSTSTYQIFKATHDSAGILEYHKRMYMFTLFFIDAANPVDADNENWRFYMLFKMIDVDKEPRYEFMGFSTLYNFYAYPEHIRPRISQFLLMPNYQRQGHGEQLLGAIYGDHEGNANVKDLTAEDPTNEFILLRDYVTSKICWPKLVSCGINSEGLVDNATIKAIAEQYKISKQQLIRTAEAFILSKINRSEVTSLKKYRLLVKRRLHTLLKEQLDTIDEKKEKLALLEMSYKETEMAYQTLINKITQAEA
eukprot:CFRG3096T1